MKANLYDIKREALIEAGLDMYEIKTLSGSEYLLDIRDVATNTTGSGCILLKMDSLKEPEHKAMLHTNIYMGHEGEPTLPTLGDRMDYVPILSEILDGLGDVYSDNNPDQTSIVVSIKPMAEANKPFAVDSLEKIYNEISSTRYSKAMADKRSE